MGHPFHRRLPAIRLAGNMSRRSMTPFVIFVAAVSLVCIAVVMALGQHLWLRKAEITDGVVTELVASRTSKGGTVHRPTVAYRTFAGESREITNATASSPPSFEVGEAVKVAYDPGSDDARILTFARRFGVSAALAGIAIGLMVTLGIFQAGEKMVPGIYLEKADKNPLEVPVEKG